MSAGPNDTCAPRSPSGAARPRRSVRVVTVAAVAAGIALVWFVGRALTADGTDLHLAGGYVLVGGIEPVLTPRLLLPVLVAVAVVAWGPGLAARTRWPVLLGSSALAAALWAVTVALVRGWGRLAEPMASKHEYVADVGRVGDLGSFLSTFLDSVPVGSADPWVTHVSGHPPGALLAFVLLDRVGLGGPGWAAVLCIAGGAVAVPAVLVAVRAIAGQAAARTVAPFAVLFPAAVWVATSADALFAGVVAWGLALLAVGAQRGAARTGAVPAATGGVLLGLSLYLSNGLAAAGLLALAVVLVQRAGSRWRGTVEILAVAAVGVLLVVVVFTAGGYWWFDGLAANAERVRDGAAFEDRPHGYFLFANIAAAAVATGPAVVAGLAGVRGRLGWVVLAALAGMAVSNASGLVLGETERIWLPFLFWLLPATASLPARTHRWWLGAAAVLTVAVEVCVGTPW